MSGSTDEMRRHGLVLILIGAALLAGSVEGPWTTPSTGQMRGSEAGLFITSPLATTTTWTQAGTGPINRSRSAVAYDASANRVVLFGGLNGLEFRNDTWAYNPSSATWANVTQGAAPHARLDSAMAYDARAGQTILFGGAWWVWDPGGGILQSTWYSDTWAFNGSSDTWTPLHPGQSPSPRNAASMVYDTVDERMILFGGYNGASWFNDTWAYDYSNGTWTNLSAGASPLPRLGASLAFDAAANQMVLFGGSDRSGTLADTWTFDYAKRTWTLITPATSPSARFWAGFVYDPSLGSDLLFGGFQTNGETWSYAASSQTWTQFSPTSSPPGTSGPTLVFVTSTSRPLLVDLQTGVSPVQTWWFVAPPVAPGAPMDLQAVAGDAKVALTWSPPGGTGGSAIENYSVYRGTVSGGEVLYAILGTVVQWTDASVANGMTYYYEVTANNSGGEGPRSSEVSATPQLPPSAPSAPRNLVATPGDAEIVLAWLVPSSDGGSAITGYRVYRGNRPGGESAFVSLGNVLTFTDTGLPNGTTYYYEVSAVNSAGESPRSNEARATAKAPDTVLPAIAIVSPANNSVVTSSTLQVSGTASDNVALARVELSLDGVTWNLANGTASWSGSVSLVSGPKTIYARATDTSGNARIVQVNVDVRLSAPGSPAATGPQPFLFGLVGLPVVLTVVVAVLLWRRRQRKGAPGAPPR